MVTRITQALSSFPRDAETIPLPREEETPPVTKINFALDGMLFVFTYGMQR
jgi:hypothetical protein